MRPQKYIVVRNPMWLSDVFVCSKIKDHDKYCYVKLNCWGKIEEIGTDAQRRLHGSNPEEMVDFIVPTTRTHKMRFNSIGTEYWWGLINEAKRNSVK